MTETLSRRLMLELGLSAGFALAASRGAWAAAPSAHIERLAPELDAILSPSEPVRVLATGYGGDAGQAEGPVWWREANGSGYLLFSDINSNQRIKYVPGQGVSVFKKGTNRGNGLTRDQKGRLVVCEAETRRVVRLEDDGSTTVICNSFGGKRLNRPNDVVVRSDGAIYFSDPMGPNAPEQWDVTYPGVYRVSPDLGTVSLVSDDFIQPNGLAFSPDETILYIDDSRKRHIRAFELLPNGMIAKQTDRVFADLSGPDSGVPDGMKVDSQGNVYCGGSGGLYILDKTGKKLGRIVHGGPNTTNVAFGGDDWKTLYFTSHDFLGAVNIKIAGLPVPARKIG